MKRLAVLVLAAFLAGCARAPGVAPLAPGLAAAGFQAASKGGDWVVTASSVEATLPAAPGLGDAGPLGAYGPLGLLGPIGSNLWNPSRYMDLVGNWEGWSRQLTQRGGPLSEKGPLGPLGPLGDGYPSLVPQPLAAGGAFTALGPVGPLGALGPLGPLGPMGAHGFKRDGLGRYVDGQGVVQRAVDVKWGEASRRYELVERYAGDTASQLADNDTSFLAEGAIDARDEADRYPMTSHEAQYVTIAVVPEAQLDDFDLEVVDGRGKRIAVSDSRGLVDFVQLRAKAGEKLEARVTRREHAHLLRATYRLVVVGSTAAIPVSTIRGKHQLPR